MKTAKKFTLQRLDSKYRFHFIECIAMSEDEAIAEMKRVWGGGIWQVVHVSDSLEVGVRALFYAH